MLDATNNLKLLGKMLKYEIRGKKKKLVCMWNKEKKGRVTFKIRKIQYIIITIIEWKFQANKKNGLVMDKISKTFVWINEQKKMGEKVRNKIL